MSKFHSSIRELFEDVHLFLASSLLNDVLSSTSLTHRERLLSRLKGLQNEYPELQLHFSEFESPNSDSRSTPTTPLPYVDMNGGSPYKMPFFPPNVDKENYDLCIPKEKCDSPENHSITGSEDYTSDEAKFLPEIPASDLHVCDKAGYLDKKKRESIKGWLNPFQKRWCAVKDGVLYYYEKTTDRRQKGSISLAGYEVRTLPEDSKEGKKYNNCFELVCPGKRTYQFSAASEKDLQQWIAAVEKNSRISFQGRTANRESQSFPTSPKIVEQDHSHQTAEDIYETVDDEEVEETPGEKEKCVNSTSGNEPEEELFSDQTSPDQFLNYSEWYVGLWDCLGSDDEELSFYRGDLIHVISKEYDNFAWWIGEFQGKVGFVPKSYLMEAYESC